MKLVNVWVVEGGWGNGSASFAAFDLRVEPTGWTLVDVDEPSVERQWSWQAMGGLEVVRGAGKTPDGQPATALDVIVNGWPVRVLVPSQDLTNETIEMLGAFAPVGHPLRSSPKVKRETLLRRLSDAGGHFAGTRSRARPVFLLSAASTRLRSALVVGVVLVVTVVVASIAGVATSAQTTTTTSPEASTGHGTTAPPDTGSAPAPTGATPSGQVPGSSSSAPTSAPPAVAASTGGRRAGAKKALTTRSTTGRPAGGSSTTATTKPTTSTTTRGTTTTKPATTTTVVNATTTTTRAPRPTTTTTRAPRPTTTTTTAPPPTTTSPPTTVPPTTEPPTTQPPPVTTTSLLKVVLPIL